MIEWEGCKQREGYRPVYEHRPKEVAERVSGRWSGRQWRALMHSIRNLVVIYLLEGYRLDQQLATVHLSFPIDLAST